MKKVVVLGGGNGLSWLLSGIKDLPININAVVSVCDDGKSTGKIRDEFGVFAVGDLRRVIISLSNTDKLLGEAFNYRFNTNGDFDGHTLGNFIIVALSEVMGDMESALEKICELLNVKGNVLPITYEKPKLIGVMKDGETVIGEHNITLCDNIVDHVYYEKDIKINPKVLSAIREADLITLSMGSIYTSIIPLLLGKEIIEEIDNAKAKIMYVCNMVTQPGETDDFKVSDHVKTLNSYLGKKKIEVVIANNGEISEETALKYSTLEQKEKVPCDNENLNNVNLITDDFVTIYDEKIRYDREKLATVINNYIKEIGD